MSSIDINELSSNSASFAAGSTILLNDGVYSNVNIEISCKGESDKRITIKPLNPGKVVLTGSSTIKIIGSYTTLCNITMKDGGVTQEAISINGNNNRITGFNVSYGLTDCYQMVCVNGKQNRVDHCVFRDWHKKGTWIYVSRPNKTEDYAIIDHNIFQNRVPADNSNNYCSIRIGASNSSQTSSKTTVAHNKFINCNGEIEVISNKSCDNLFYRNEMH
jgi:poly(beta-D-mannuronate) lyase